MTTCKHGTDTESDDCINCEVENEMIGEAAEEIMHRFLNGSPTLEELESVIQSLVADLEN